MCCGRASPAAAGRPRVADDQGAGAAVRLHEQSLPGQHQQDHAGSSWNSRPVANVNGSSAFGVSGSISMNSSLPASGLGRRSIGMAFRSATRIRFPPPQTVALHAALRISPRRASPPSSVSSRAARRCMATHGARRGHALLFPLGVGRIGDHQGLHRPLLCLRAERRKSGTASRPPEDERRRPSSPRQASEAAAPAAKNVAGVPRREPLPQIRSSPHVLQDDQRGTHRPGQTGGLEQQPARLGGADDDPLRPWEERFPESRREGRLSIPASAAFIPSEFPVPWPHPGERADENQLRWAKRREEGLEVTAVPGGIEQARRRVSPAAATLAVSATMSSAVQSAREEHGRLGAAGFSPRRISRRRDEPQQSQAQCDGQEQLKETGFPAHGNDVLPAAS